MNRRKWVSEIVRQVTAVIIVWPCIASHIPEGRLAGRLQRVGFQFDCWGVILPDESEWSYKWLWTEDPTLLPRVEAWLWTVRRPRPRGIENDFAQQGGRIILVFTDGRREELLFRGPRGPGPASRDCHGFIWDGEQVDYNYDKEPFSGFLQEVRASPE
jgi:hypothetical protein